MMFGDMEMGEGILKNSVWNKSHSRVLYQKCCEMLQLLSTKSTLSSNEKVVYSVKNLKKTIVKVLCTNLYEDYLDKDWKSIIWFTQGRTYHPKGNPATTVEVNMRLDQDSNLVVLKSQEKTSNVSEESRLVSFRRVQADRKVESFWRKHFTFTYIGSWAGKRGTKKIVNLQDMILYNILRRLSRTRKKEVTKIEFEVSDIQLQFDYELHMGLDLLPLWTCVNQACYHLSLLATKIRCRTNPIFDRILKFLFEEKKVTFNFKCRKKLRNDMGPVEVLSHVENHGISKSVVDYLKKFKEQFESQSNSV